MAVAGSSGLAQADAVDDAGVVQLVGQHCVLVAENRLEQPAVGVPARRIEDGVILAEEACDGAFQLLVQILSAANEAYRRQPIAVASEPFMGRLDDGRMIGQAKVVIGAEVDDLAAADLDGGSLWPLQLALAFVQSAGLEVVELRLQDLAEMLFTHGVTRPGAP